MRQDGQAANKAKILPVAAQVPGGWMSQTEAHQVGACSGPVSPAVEKSPSLGPSQTCLDIHP